MAGGVWSSLTGRGALSQLAAGGGTPQAAGQVSAPDLRRLTSSPLTVELPDEEPHILTPGPSRRVLGVEIAEFSRVGPLAIRQVVRE